MKEIDRIVLPLKKGTQVGSLCRHGDEGVSISLMLDDWLHEDARFGSVRWYTAEDWSGGGEWRERPY